MSVGKLLLSSVVPDLSVQINSSRQIGDKMRVSPQRVSKVLIIRYSIRQLRIRIVYVCLI